MAVALSGTLISLVVSDVDGTLVTGNKRLTDENIKAAAKLAEAGVGLSLVSSRPPVGLSTLAASLGLTAPLGAFNGGAIIRPDLSVIEQMFVPAEAARIALAAFDAHGIDSWLFTNETWYVADLEGAYVAKERNTIRHAPTRVASFDALLDKVGKLVGSSDDFAAVARCEAHLQARLGTAASAKRSQKYYLDVTPSGADKGFAVKTIASALHVPIEEVAVIGDMSNDIPMFDIAHHRIAMGNAVEELKRVAEYVTGSNEESGFAVAVDRYVLPRAQRRRSS